MDLAINHLLDHNKPDVMLIETSGSSHPLPLVKYLRRHSRVRLKAFLTLVDTVMLHEDYNDGEKKLIPTLQENLRHNKRGTGEFAGRANHVLQQAAADQK